MQIWQISSFLDILSPFWSQSLLNPTNLTNDHYYLQTSYKGGTCLGYSSSYIENPVEYQDDFMVETQDCCTKEEIFLFFLLFYNINKIGLLNVFPFLSKHFIG